MALGLHRVDRLNDIENCIASAAYREYGDRLLKKNITVIKCLYSARTECVTSVCTVLNRCWCRRGAPFELNRG